MSEESGYPIEVTADGITVRKTFEPDEFPVPAMKFVIVSHRDSTVDVRLVDEIPESFPMEHIGFHPEYESDRWTAYQDHRVEYERPIDPGEEVVTVYGIRADGEADLEAFATEPTVEEVDPGEERDDLEEVLGEDSGQAVRDVLAGRSDSLPGEESPETAGAGGDDGEVRVGDEGGTGPPEEAGMSGSEPREEAELDRSAPDDDGETAGPAPREMAPDAEPAVRETTAGPDRMTAPESAETSEADSAQAEPQELDLEVTAGTESGDEGEGEMETEAATSGQPVEPVETTDEGDEEAVDERTDTAQPAEGDQTRTVPGSTGESEPTSGAPADGDSGGVSGSTPEEGVTAALARELREGDVAQEDRETLAKELDIGTPRSLDVRINRLQSKVEDLWAYSDAIEEFIDENGTAREILESLEADLETVSDGLEDLEDELDAAAEERADLRATTADHEDRLADAETERAGLGDDLESLAGDVDALDASLSALEDDLGDVTADVEDLGSRLSGAENDISDLDGRVDALDEDIEAVRSDLADERERLEGEIADLHERIDDMQRFRERLSSVFTPEEREELEDG